MDVFKENSAYEEIVQNVEMLTVKSNKDLTFWASDLLFDVKIICNVSLCTNE
jgi:hypothetical protein